MEDVLLKFYFLGASYWDSALTFFYLFGCEKLNSFI